MNRKKHGTYQDTSLELRPGLTVALRVHEEVRRGIRASIGKKHLIFRLPHGLSASIRRKYLDHLTDWARQTFRQRPDSFQHLLPVSIPERGQIEIMGQTFHTELKRVPPDRESHFVRYAPGNPPQLTLHILSDADPSETTEVAETLISRQASNIYLPQVSRRVHELNDRHFRRPIQNVRLKLTTTRWGSCSSKGNINLSSRLLLAPAPVRDAVIVHELAHRIEMNHSNRFWKLVYDAMPDYDIHHDYLDRHGRAFRFLPVER